MPDFKTLTSQNSTLVLNHDALFAQGIQIEKFSTDAAYAAEDVEKGIMTKGVDGKTSVARVPYVLPFTITLSSDSDSNDVFDAIEEYEELQKEISKVRFTLTCPSLKKAYTFSDCIITNMNPLPPHQRTIGPRAYKIACGDWKRVVLSA